MDEFELIRNLAEMQHENCTLYAEKNGTGKVVIGIGDDAAVIRPSEGMEQVMTCDTMIEPFHFLPWTMRYHDIGFKALAANVSDIAAMGAIPRWALIAVSRPSGVSEEQMKELYGGLYTCADLYGVQIIGGDMTGSAQHLVVTVTLIGEIEKGRALLRSSAKPGDIVFVTGKLGGSAAGLDFLLKQKEESLAEDKLSSQIAKMVQIHRRPRPHVLAGRILSQTGKRLSLNDISDGLASEIHEIASASKCGILLREADIPVLPEARDYAAQIGESLHKWVLFGGEEYVLLGTISPNDFQEVKRLFHQRGLQIFHIGEVTDQSVGVKLLDKHGNMNELEPGGYRHF